MKHLILFCSLALLSPTPGWAKPTISVWQYSPKPKFPTDALKKGSEGSVTLRIVIAKDGSVAGARIAKSSGDSALDEVARTKVLKWRMNPSSIKPEDLTKGREQIIKFRQEAWAAASYRDGTAAYFNDDELISSKRWMYAPFPEYPIGARARQQEGRVIFKVRIGTDGRVVETQTLQSSGFATLDQAALAAVKQWRAHKEYGGSVQIVPINFRMKRR